MSGRIKHRGHDQQQPRVNEEEATGAHPAATGMRGVLVTVRWSTDVQFWIHDTELKDAPDWKWLEYADCHSMRSLTTFTEWLSRRWAASSRSILQANSCASFVLHTK